MKFLSLLFLLLSVTASAGNPAVIFGSGGRGLIIPANGLEFKAGETLSGSEALAARLSLSTGLVSGGDITVGAPTSTVTISDGNGYIVDATSDATNPVITPVSWSGLTNVVVPNLPGTFTTFGIDITGTLIQKANDVFSAVEMRTIIQLGSAVHESHVQIDSLASNPSIITSIGASRRDLASSIGSINRSGNVFVASGANLILQRTSGETYLEGSNYSVDINSPNIRVDVAEDPVNFGYIYRDGIGGFTIVPGTAIIPGFWDDGTGTLNAMSANRWSVQRIYYLSGTGRTVIHYGQAEYLNMGQAIDGILAEPFIALPGLSGASFRAWVLVRGAAVNLQDPADASFVEADKFGQAPVSGGVATIGDFQEVYENSNQPQIILDATRNGIQILDNASAIGAPFFEVLSNDTFTNYLTVEASGISTNALTVVGNTTLDTGLTGPARLTSGLVSTGDINLTSEVTGVLPIANGGTGTSIKSYVDLSTSQAINGDKTFLDNVAVVVSDASAGVLLANTGSGKALQTTAEILFKDRVSPSAKLFAISNNLDNADYLSVAVSGALMTVPLSTSADVAMTGTGQLGLASGTTAQRSVAPAEGMVRHNTEKSAFEGYDSGAWKDLSGDKGSLEINGFLPTANPNAEDGVTDWSASGGSFAATITDPLEKKRSFEFTPGALGQTVTSSSLDFNKDIFKGRNCEASFEYIGSDDNLEFQVIDGNNDILNADHTGDDRKILARTSTGQKSVFFICPTAAAIAGDANKGSLRFRIAHTGASLSPIIKWDFSYIGTIKGLMDTTLPSRSSLVMSGGNIITRSSDIYAGLADWGTVGPTISFRAGTFSIPPAVVCNIQETAASGSSIHARDVTANSFKLEFLNASGGQVAINQATSCIVDAQGVDAQQTIQTYKAIPQTFEDSNHYSARIDTAGNILSQGGGTWLTGTCGLSGGSRRCNFINTSFTTIPMSCTASMYYVTTGGAVVHYAMTTVTLDYLEYNATVGGVGNNAFAFDIQCDKQGVDEVKPQTRNISLAGIVVNSYAEVNQKQVRTESCFVNGDVATPTTLSATCDNWIDSLAPQVITIKNGIFSATPDCVFSVGTTGNDNAVGYAGSPTLVNVRTFNTITGSTLFLNYSVTCTGVK